MEILSKTNIGPGETSEIIIKINGDKIRLLDKFGGLFIEKIHSHKPSSLVFFPYSLNAGFVK